MDNRELIDKAKSAMKNAYAPYSGFRVGAAVLTQNGQIYVGCNIENSSYGATICAERVAIFKAVSDGNTKIKKIAIVGSSKELTPPCGMCRQVMSEFMSDSQIIMEDIEGNIVEIDFNELFPLRFELDH